MKKLKSAHPIVDSVRADMNNMKYRLLSKEDIRFDVKARIQEAKEQLNKKSQVGMNDHHVGG